MPSAQSPQALPSFSVALRSDHYRTVLPNLSFPSRPNSHIPWSGFSAPLVFSKTASPELPVTASTNVQIPTTANIFDACSVPDAFYGISMLIKHYLSMAVQKLKLIKQKLFGIRTTSISVTGSV